MLRKSLVLALLLALGLLLVPRLGTEFLPELNEGSIWINIPLHASVSVSEARTEMAKIRAAIAHIPEINTIVYKAGRPEDGTDPKLISMAEFLIDIKPESEWKRKITKQGIIREMEAELDKLPGVQASFSQPIRDNILESISQIDGQIVVKIFGDDLAVLKEQSQQVLAAISDVPGVARAIVDGPIGPSRSTRASRCVRFWLPRSPSLGGGWTLYRHRGGHRARG